MWGPDLRLRQRGRTKPFDPATLFAGGVGGAWYDPGDLSTMSQDAAGGVPAQVGAPVGRILDKSGNGGHLTQPEAAARPTLEEGADGRLCLRFDGVDDTLTGPGTIVPAGGSLLCVAAAARDGAGSFPYVWAGAGDTGLLLLYEGVSRRPGAAVVYAGGDAAVVTALTAMPDGARHVLRAEWDRSAPAIRLHVNGQSTGSTVGQARDLAQPSNYAMGSRGDNMAFFPGRVFGLLIVGGLRPPAQVRNLDRWFRQRCGP